MTRGARIGVLLVLGWCAACRSTPLPVMLEQQVRARALASDLAVQFSRSADASSQAVMAESDEASAAFAHTADDAAGRAQQGVEALSPLLDGLGYTREAALLKEFASRFARYRTLDREILDLAVENTNLKAQRLSFGAGQAAVDAMREALRRAVPPSTAPATAQMLAASATAEVREIQVIQPRHIAEARDEAMTAMEARMADAATLVRRALASLAAVPGTERSGIGDAVNAFDRFMQINAEIVKLSRRNSDVRSLALSLGEKRMAAAACEESLDALQAALDTHSLAATR